MEQVSYFTQSGNWTDHVFETCRKYAETNGIKDIVVASTTGETGARASKAFRGHNLVVVTHSAGFKEPGKVEIIDQQRKVIEENGGKVLIATHALSGVERAFRKKHNTVGPVEFIASALRIFGEGTKVCIEIAIMAADAGLISVDEDVICIAGTGNGADTAILMRPANSANFFDLKVRKYLCKPVNF